MSFSDRALPLFPTVRVSLIRRMLGTLTGERSQSDAFQKARRVRFQNRVDTSNNGLTQDRFVAEISPSQADADTQNSHKPESFQEAIKPIRAFRFGD